MLKTGFCAVLALLWLDVAAARQVQEVGTDATFDVATWNIEWFGSTSNGPSNEDSQFDNVVEIIEASGIDLWALQEIADAGAFDSLLERLGADWAGTLATNSGQQRIGYVYRTAIVQPRRIEHIQESFAYEYAFRPPLQLEAAITLPDTSFVVTVITAHMKCCSDATSHSRRTEASGRLKSRMDFLEPESNVIILGDLNDELRASITPGQPSPYANFMSDTANWRFLTLPLEDAGTCTFCGSSLTSTIDHILVSNELFTAADAGTTDRHSSVIMGISGFYSTTSDHVPVFSRLLPTASATSVDQLPAAKESLQVWPNPAVDRIRIELGDDVDVRQAGGHSGQPIRLVDLLGRTVRSWTMPRTDTSADLPLDGVPAGTYVLDAGPWGHQVLYVN